MTTPVEVLGPGREFDLVRLFLGEGGVEGGEIHVGPGDDAAVLEGGGSIVVSTDLTVEDVHFRREWIEPEEIGYRSVIVALSDLAAMAARPVGVLVSAALPAEDSERLARGLSAGVRDACTAHGAPLMGGDLARSPGPLVLDVVAVGRTHGSPPRRSGVRPGDELWVTGTLGASGLAVREWEGGGSPGRAARAAFARPVPRLSEARWLAETCGPALHALIDLSDGLAGDARHLAAASGVELVLEEGRIPVHAAVSEALGAGEEALRLALSAGEDYELLAAVAPGSLEEVEDEFEDRFGVSLRRVGLAGEGSGVRLEDGGGRRTPLRPGGFDHFGGGGSP